MLHYATSRANLSRNVIPTENIARKLQETLHGVKAPLKRPMSCQHPELSKFVKTGKLKRQKDDRVQPYTVKKTTKLLDAWDMSVPVQEA